MPMYVDYLTYSITVDTGYGSRLRTQYYGLAADPASRPLYRRSVKGFVKDGFWLGYSDKRIYVNVSGSNAENALPDIVENLREDVEAFASMSVSRIDLQQTYLVDFSVLGYIQSLTPSPEYKTMLVMSKYGDNKGIGVYVGSVTSDKRLRVYDKGAQIAAQTGKSVTDMYGDGGLLRIELVLRKQVAQKALFAIVNGDREALYTSYRGECVKRIPQLEPLMDMPIAPSGIDLVPEKLGRTEKWLIEQVLPALARVYMSNPAFYDEFMRQLAGRLTAVSARKG